MQAREVEPIETTYASVAIMQAIADIERIESMEDWCIEMDRWHAPVLSSPRGRERCGVCMGGAMLARATGYSWGESLSPNDVQDHEQARVICAMDDIRENLNSMIVGGLLHLNVAPGDAREVVYRTWTHYGDFVEYSDSPEKFKAQRLGLAANLAAMGY